MSALRFGLAVLIATLISVPLAAEEGDKVEPLFSEPLQLNKRLYSQRHFTPFELINAVSPKIESTTIYGRLSRIGYQLPPSTTSAHLFADYRNRIEELKGRIQFECRAKACGSESKLNKFTKPLFGVGRQEPHLLVATLELAQKQIAVQIYTATTAKYTTVQIDQIELLERAPMLVRPNPDYLNSHVSEIAVADQSHNDQKGSADHPMLTRIPGAHIVDYQQYQFGQTPVLTGISAKELQLESLEGKITDILYQLPRTYSEYEVHKNYQKALTELGFVERFHCQGTQCPKKKTLLNQIKLLSNNGFDEHQFYSLYVLNRAAGDIHAMSYVIGYSGRLISEIRIIEEATLVDDRIAIDLDSLTSKIAQSGHVALDGLLFEFDSDKMLPEADEVIAVVATYLKSNPKQGFYVVGHTDDQGKQAYNQNLSKKRANAVLQRLINEHGISKKQLVAVGLGEHAPVATNSTDQGKKLNRRVELVLRSDGR